MDDLVDFFKKLLMIYAIVFIIAALPFVLVRVVEVCGSEEGLWPAPEAIGAGGNDRNRQATPEEYLNRKSKFANRK